MVERGNSTRDEFSTLNARQRGTLYFEKCQHGKKRGSVRLNHRVYILFNIGRGCSAGLGMLYHCTISTRVMLGGAEQFKKCQGFNKGDAL